MFAGTHWPVALPAKRYYQLKMLIFISLEIGKGMKKYDYKCVFFILF